MASNRPDPGDFLEMAQRMLRELFEPRGGDEPRSEDDLWGDATRRWRESFSRERTETPRRHREPSPEEQRENLTFALATRAVEALEDLALKGAAIRQRLERRGTQEPEPEQQTGERRPEGDFGIEE